jgi:uncharacterized membrane protein
MSRFTMTALFGLIAFALVGTFAAIAAAEGSTEGGSCEVTYDSFGKSFLDTYCVRCHSAEKTGFARYGAPDKVNLDVLDIVKKDKKDIVKLVAVKKQMPPSGLKPTDEERAKVKTWLECEY